MCETLENGRNKYVKTITVFLFNIKIYHLKWSVVKVLSKHLAELRKPCKIRLFQGFCIIPTR